MSLVGTMMYYIRIQLLPPVLPAAVITHKHHLDIKLTAFCQHEIRRNTCRMFTLQQYNFIRLHLT